jgi:hypothetical protein
MKRLTLSAAALVFALAASSSAHAGCLNFVCRHLGLGWSDGYHAQCDCGPACRSMGKGGKCYTDMKVEVCSPCFGAGARIVPKYAPGPLQRP